MELRIALNGGGHVFVIFFGRLESKRHVKCRDNNVCANRWRPTDALPTAVTSPLKPFVAVAITRRHRSANTLATVSRVADTRHDDQ